MIEPNRRGGCGAVLRVPSGLTETLEQRKPVTVSTTKLVVVSMTEDRAVAVVGDVDAGTGRVHRDAERGTTTVTVPMTVLVMVLITETLPSNWLGPRSGPRSGHG